MKRVDPEVLRDMWLSKYHNTCTKELIEKHPKEVLESADWFKLYPCTQAQYDEWCAEVKDVLKKKYKWSKYMIDRNWWWIILQISPYVKDYDYERSSR
jgi:arginine/lysine/ornithine decarboxylase